MNLKHVAMVLMVPAAAMLVGCASTGYGCPLKDSKGYCASVTDTYSAAKHGGGDPESVFAGKSAQTIHHPDRVQDKTEKPTPFTTLPAPPTGGTPVYTPGAPWRVWIAPWFDPATHVLHGGSYVFFSTPSHWAYGSLGSPGAASGLLGPISPKDLGFTPRQQAAGLTHTSTTRPHHFLVSTK